MASRHYIALKVTVFLVSVWSCRSAAKAVANKVSVCFPHSVTGIFCVAVNYSIIASFDFSKPIFKFLSVVKRSQSLSKAKKKDHVSKVKVWGQNRFCLCGIDLCYLSNISLFFLQMFSQKQARCNSGKRSTWTHSLFSIKWLKHNSKCFSFFGDCLF